MMSSSATASGTQQPQAQQTPTASSTPAGAPSSTSASKPPVSLPPSAHLDPNAYVRGSHQITIGQNAVIHPRCQLSSDSGPLSIGDNTLISEKCVVGGQAPKETSDSDHSTGTGIEIGHHVHVHQAVHIHSPSTVSPYAVLESNVVISAGASVGRHSKICANITIPPDSVVPDYTVVFGDSSNLQRRRRRQKDATEEGRLAVLEREREGSMVLLRQTALKSLSSGSARKK